MPFLHRDDVALYYEQSSGDGPPVVLIHGWCCDHTFFAPQAAHFAKAGHAVIALDLRGHGRSDKPHQNYPISALADDVVWVCGELGLSRPTLVGHSMGGIVAFDVACRHPDLPSALVMLDSAVVLPAAVRVAIPEVLERLSGSDYPAALRGLVNDAFFLPTDDAARRARILDVMAAAPQYVMAAAYAGLADYDAGAVASRLKAPSLYIAANEPSPRADMDRLAALVPHMLRGQTVGAGHFCQLEVPEQVNAMINRFLDILPSAARR
jgi:pimeloyl-ACP methyl ester carboxylesterase